MNLVDFDLISKLLSIIAIDLVLSGDNAVVIAMASRRLPPAQRKKAIIYGGGGAVVLRILFTIGAALLLGVPLLQAIGGLLLIYIAIKLIQPASSDHSGVQAADTLGAAIRTIIMADIVMSLDNMLAVGGAAHGHIGLLIFGLMLSIPILLFGSSAIARLIDRYPWLNLVGAAILVHTALEMFFNDKYVLKFIHLDRLVELAIILAIVAAIAALGWLWNKRAQDARDKAQHGRPLDTTEPAS
ncbi:MAG TPA: tellurium resistance protein TerC [Chloroflexi bacterium]|nr:tellurium resistance protein TerC [Chloroflexota bacterium]HCG29074.1 tellurium resistance protein TerC [Chloroflexota bacterium]